MLVGQGGGIVSKNFRPGRVMFVYFVVPRLSVVIFIVAVRGLELPDLYV